MKEEGAEMPQLMKYLSTHPDTDSRIKNISSNPQSKTVFSENANQENNVNELKSNSIISEVGKVIEQLLKPTYTSNTDDELLKKKKRKSR